MKYYVIGEINITNSNWIADYLEKVTPMVEKYGGKYLARTTNIECIEGQHRPQVALLIEFPSKESVESFYNSDEYQPYLKARKEGSNSKMLLVAGEDNTKRTQ